MHIYKRQGHVPASPEETHALDTTLGEVMRYIYYGDKKLIHDGKQPEEYKIARTAMDFWDKLARITPL